VFTFYITADDGAKLSVNDLLIAENVQDIHKYNLYIHAYTLIHSQIHSLTFLVKLYTCVRVRSCVRACMEESKRDRKREKVGER